VRTADGLLCLLTDDITTEVMDVNPNLKIISNYAVGYNNIDVEAATKRGIQVTNTPGVLTDTTADLAWALIMAVGRRVVEGDVFTREGRFEGWILCFFLELISPARRWGLSDGTYRSGGGSPAIGFDMRILYHDMAPVPVAEEEYQAEFVALDELLRQSDFVTIHAPLTDETRHMIGDGS